jgi:hypothetical protein
MKKIRFIDSSYKDLFEISDGEDTKIYLRSVMAKK